LTNEHHKISPTYSCRNIILQKHRLDIITGKKLCCRLVIVLAKTKQFRDKRIRKNHNLKNRQFGSSLQKDNALLSHS